jgi:hypothetical protein
MKPNMFRQNFAIIRDIQFKKLSKVLRLYDTIFGTSKAIYYF